MPLLRWEPSRWLCALAPVLGLRARSLVAVVMRCTTRQGKQGTAAHHTQPTQTPALPRPSRSHFAGHSAGKGIGKRGDGVTGPAAYAAAGSACACARARACACARARARAHLSCARRRLGRASPAAYARARPGTPGARGCAAWPLRSAPDGGSVLGSWGNTMRGVVRNKSR